MPVIQIKATRTNLTREARAEIVREITGLMVRVLGKKPENVHIIIEPVDDENWGHGGELVVSKRERAGG